ncbi:MAG: hypothetical protein JW841_04955 [Deltaproteobacteria bacterium]|nr:hypothetical protein [Deltaproteobacteria bacterium]
MSKPVDNKPALPAIDLSKFQGTSFEAAVKQLEVACEQYVKKHDANADVDGEPDWLLKADEQKAIIETNPEYHKIFKLLKNYPLGVWSNQYDLYNLSKTLLQSQIEQLHNATLKTQDGLASYNITISCDYAEDDNQDIKEANHYNSIWDAPELQGLKNELDMAIIRQTNEGLFDDVAVDVIKLICTPYYKQYNKKFKAINLTWVKEGQRLAFASIKFIGDEVIILAESLSDVRKDLPGAPSVEPIKLSTSDIVKINHDESPLGGTISYFDNALKMLESVVHITYRKSWQQFLQQKQKEVMAVVKQHGYDGKTVKQAKPFSYVKNAPLLKGIQNKLEDLPYLAVGVPIDTYPEGTKEAFIELENLSKKLPDNINIIKFLQKSGSLKSLRNYFAFIAWYFNKQPFLDFSKSKFVNYVNEKTPIKSLNFAQIRESGLYLKVHGYECYHKTLGFYLAITDEEFSLKTYNDFAYNGYFQVTYLKDRLPYKYRLPLMIGDDGIDVHSFIALAIEDMEKIKKENKLESIIVYNVSDQHERTWIDNQPPQRLFGEITDYVDQQTISLLGKVIPSNSYWDYTDIDIVALDRNKNGRERSQFLEKPISQVCMKIINEQTITDNDLNILYEDDILNVIEALKSYAGKRKIRYGTTSLEAKLQEIIYDSTDKKKQQWTVKGVLEEISRHSVEPYTYDAFAARFFVMDVDAGQKIRKQNNIVVVIKPDVCGIKNYEELKSKIDNRKMSKFILEPFANHEFDGFQLSDDMDGRGLGEYFWVTEFLW